MYLVVFYHYSIRGKQKSISAKNKNFPHSKHTQKLYFLGK